MVSHQPHRVCMAGEVGSVLHRTLPTTRLQSKRASFSRVFFLYFFFVPPFCVFYDCFEKDFDFSFSFFYPLHFLKIFTPLFLLFFFYSCFVFSFSLISLLNISSFSLFCNPCQCFTLSFYD